MPVLLLFTCLFCCWFCSSYSIFVLPYIRKPRQINEIATTVSFSFQLFRFRCSHFAAACPSMTIRIDQLPLLNWQLGSQLIPSFKHLCEHKVKGCLLPTNLPLFISCHHPWFLYKKRKGTPLSQSSVLKRNILFIFSQQSSHKSASSCNPS